MIIIYEFICRIKFVVVAEPPEDQEALNCIDIGYATVNAKQLLRNEADCIEKRIDGKNSISFWKFSLYFFLFQ